MDELTKVWQVWDRTKIKMWLECDTHKNKETNRVKNNLIQNVCAGVSISLGLETAQNNNKKYEQRVMYSKSSVVVALCLLPTERMNF
jgi:hypothetical protein